MNIVIISRTCFPAKAPRSHRATELAKEFARQGHNVSLYALLGDYNYTQFSKQTGVHFKNLGKAKYGMPSNTTSMNKKWNYRLMRNLGKVIMFPECTLKPMISKAIEQEGEIDLLVTIAVPHIIHFAAACTDRKKVKCWVADCGDPFMGNPMHKPFFYFEWFERYWCKRCDFITVPIEEAKDAYYKEYRNKIRVIPQGFDFNATNLADYKPNTVPTFAYSGIFYKDTRDPSKFMEYLSNLDSNFKFVCYTKGLGLLKPFAEKLGSKLEVRDYVPREELLYELSKMDFLVNVPNKSGVQQPSKLIDYALTHRPVINLSSDFTNEEKTVLNEFLKADYRHSHIFEDLEKYNIVNVAKSFLELTK